MATDARPRINPIALAPEVAAAAAAINRQWDEKTRSKRLRCDWRPIGWKVPETVIEEPPEDEESVT